MSNGVFTGTIIVAKDGSLNFALQSLRVKSAMRFTPSQLLPLKEWLNSATDAWELTQARDHALHVSYSHETGKIRLEAQSGVQYYDAASDEALARFVRYLKSKTPIPEALSGQPTLPDLPIPTPEQLANAQRYKHAMPAQGYTGQGGRRVTKRPLTSARASAKLDELLRGLVAERRKA